MAIREECRFSAAPWLWSSGAADRDQCARDPRRCVPGRPRAGPARAGTGARNPATRFKIRHAGRPADRCGARASCAHDGRSDRSQYGRQVLWIPNNDIKLVFNSYFLGEDNLVAGSGNPANGGSPTADIGRPESHCTLRELRPRASDPRGRQCRMALLPGHPRRRSAGFRKWHCRSRGMWAASTAVE